MSTPVEVRSPGATGSTPPPGSRRQRVTSGLVTVALAVLVLGYIAGPATWQWIAAARAERAAAPGSEEVADQVTVPASVVDPALVDQLASAPASPQGGPVIVTYHEIGYSASPYSITPEAFAAQMQLLHDAGWQTATAGQLGDWLAGRPMPPHTAMITFDDGARGVWRYADPVLARNGQNAVSFIITGFVGTHPPYYLTWPELTRLAASGRWDLEAHTHLGHVEVPTSATGATGPFLTSLEYLEAQQRVENLDEYRARVTGDLAESRRQLVEHGFAGPHLFAYPFSAYEGAPAGTGLLQEIVRSQFDAAMLDQADAVATTTATDLAAGNIARMDVTADVSLTTWAVRVVGATPLDPATSAPSTRPGEWTDPAGSVAALPLDDRGEIALDPAPRTYTSRLFAPRRTALWRDYTVAATLGGFREADDGATAGLIVLSGDPQQVDILVGFDRYVITQGPGDGKPLFTGRLDPRPGHPVEAMVRPGGISVRIDGRAVADVTLVASPNGTAPAGGLAISADRLVATSPVPRIEELTVR